MTAPTRSGSFFDLQHVDLWDAAYCTDRLAGSCCGVYFPNLSRLTEDRE